MLTHAALRQRWEAYAAREDYWRSRSRFYYAYVENLIKFLVPEGVRVLRVTSPLEEFEVADAAYDYIVVSDLLGYVYDIQDFFERARKALAPNGRIVVTQYSALWEPILRLASLLRLRAPSNEQNWIAPKDLKAFLHLAGFDLIDSGGKLLVPKYIPLINSICNTFLANLWPFSVLGLIRYAVACPQERAAIAGEPSFSIIVPARNEAGTIERIANELPVLGAFTEIIFIEGNSTDHTRAEIERVTKAYAGKARVRYALQDGKGKGDAVRKGFMMAEGDILAIYDADMTVPPEDMRKFYRALVEGRGDFINGSRLVYPVEKGAMRLLNMAANAFFGAAFTAILGQPLKDTLCGTKVLWRADYERIANNRAFFGDFDPFGDFDLLFGAAKLNLRIIDLPVRYRDRVYGETNISRWKHGWLLLKMTVFAARKLKFR